MNSETAQKCILAGLAVLVLSLPSCAVVAVGAIVGAIRYVEGELVTNVSADIHQVVAATNAASQNLGLRPQSKTGDEDKAVMVALRPNDDRVVVKLIPSGRGVTKVKIRVGVWGDEAYSRRILSEIERYLAPRSSPY